TWANASSKGTSGREAEEDGDEEGFGMTDRHTKHKTSPPQVPFTKTGSSCPLFDATRVLACPIHYKHRGFSTVLQHKTWTTHSSSSHFCPLRQFDAKALLQNCLLFRLSG